MFSAITERVRGLLQHPDLSDQALRGTPAIGGAVASAWTLNTWVMLGTGVYIVLQIAYLGRKWWREERDYARTGTRRKS